MKTIPILTPEQQKEKSLDALAKLAIKAFFSMPEVKKLMANEAQVNEVKSENHESQNRTNPFLTD